MLTELDCCILGVIWRDGPMSAYGVRSHFAQSRTVEWSSSQGTVYPAIRRLREARLVNAAAPSGPRRTEMLSVTDAGIAALRQWLTNAVPNLGSPTADPIRTRVHFLQALNAEERQQVIDAYRKVTLESLASFRASVAKPAATIFDRSENLGRIGAIMELEARLAWLDLAERELSNP